MHVVSHLDRPHANVRAYADVFDFEVCKSYAFGIEFDALLGPGVYNIVPRSWEYAVTMVIDWGWKRLTPISHMP